jgi:hypothetical protein
VYTHKYIRGRQCIWCFKSCTHSYKYSGEFAGLLEIVNSDIYIHTYVYIYFFVDCLYSVLETVLICIKRLDIGSCIVKSMHMVKIDTSLFKVSKVCEDHILIRVDRVGGLKF